MTSKYLRFFFILALNLACFRSSIAQYSEFGIMIGGANYKGELSDHVFNTDFIHPAFGIFYRHNWNRHWGWKAELNYGKISGDDAESSMEFSNDRNLSFFSNILEFSPQLEFNFLPYETGNSDYPFTPYIFTGLSVFHFNPKAELNNEVYELQPLGTEGQNLGGPGPYHRVQFAIPIGGGIKISAGRFGIGLEIGARRTYTDYLDDVSTAYPDLQKLLSVDGPVAVMLSDRSYSRLDTSSSVLSFGKQRGFSNDKDWYLFGGITIYFRMSSFQRDICKPFKKRRYI